VLNHNLWGISVAFLAVRLYILLSEFNGAFHAHTGREAFWILVFSSIFVLVSGVFYVLESYSTTGFHPG